ncbi:molybdopterin molybdotransferase MoeA [Myxococcus sp. MISCRS1]|uniref:molybdopterin molybdotransferase MoeA n=1 Tax=Myxococcus TaxID=32 RepID=UPI001CBF0F06|nr:MULTISPECIES: gephyrin-like molybdotransferase Glp [unclassified Myxococcus]MBZ4400947.1 molybdopterin molybdotransferase MoeA [Myxococcus sp. AS-1-15]MBZ4409510.1 molybdopterin molybdotransferase MoeA [Myxococcus sp. XM-1-1-1]MCY1003061.1 molybdopterin molybdotransferase MoeA [Myxococcus sp. MISCRS1]BDT35352.1 molybdopterin molybdotransferase MoeA [Myxococcus sp. MH1]
MNDAATLLPEDEARARVLALVPPLATEWVSLDEGLGRTLAEDVMAQRTLPPWDNSAMDGYAVRASDLTGPLPVRLPVLETVYAGATPRHEVRPGTCVRIMTGAPLPDGADAVVMRERARPVPNGGADQVDILEAVESGQFVRPRGEDAHEGALLLARGTPLGIPELGLLWGQGQLSIPVPRAPRVAILSTGDELCRADEPPKGRIVDTNAPSLALAVRRAGGLPSLLGIAQDTRDSVSEFLSRAHGFDVVLTSAGVSVGERDYVKEVLAALGVEQHLWRVAIKPGKPLVVGKRGSTLFFGLPGNPTSSLVTFELFVRPALRRLLGHSDVAPIRVSGRLDGRLAKSPGLAHFVRVTATWREGSLWARPLSTQTSGALRSAASATHLLHFPREASSLSHGDGVELLPVSWGA